MIKDNKKYFIERSIIIHNNKYNYCNIRYINARTSVEIICPLHGEFHQTPSNHLSGKGCKQCGIERNRACLLKRRISLFWMQNLYMAIDIHMIIYYI